MKVGKEVIEVMKVVVRAATAAIEVKGGVVHIIEVTALAARGIVVRKCIGIAAIGTAVTDTPVVASERAVIAVVVSLARHRLRRRGLLLAH